MAQAASPAVAAGGPRRRIRLESVDLATGSQSDTDLRSAVARTRVFGGDHSRQSGPGGAGPRAVDFRSGGDEEDAPGISHAGDAGGSSSESAHPVQELRSETVLQGRPGMPDRGNVPQSE